MDPLEWRHSVFVLAGAWGVTTAAAILAAGGAGASVGDAVLAPLWVASGVGLLAYGPGRRGLRAVAVCLVVAGLARGWVLLAGLDALGVVPAADELADAAVLVGVVFLCYDIAATRRVDGSSE
jgi:hypothetical protein